MNAELIQFPIHLTSRRRAPLVNHVIPFRRPERYPPAEIALLQH
jgi:hypothetical protein